MYVYIHYIYIYTDNILPPNTYLFRFWSAFRFFEAAPACWREIHPFLKETVYPMFCLC